MHTLYFNLLFSFLQTLKKFQIYMCTVCDYTKYKFTSFHKNQTTLIKIILHILVDYKTMRNF